MKKYNLNKSSNITKIHKQNIAKNKQVRSYDFKF